MWSAKGDIMVKGVEELLTRIESVRRELNEQALHDNLPSLTMLEKSRELDRLLNVIKRSKRERGSRKAGIPAFFKVIGTEVSDLGTKMKRLVEGFV